MRRGRFIKAQCMLCQPDVYNVDQDEIGEVQHCGKPGVPCMMRESGYSSFDRSMLNETLVDVKKHFSKEVIKAAWVHKSGSQWEFVINEGTPGLEKGFYWNGQAGSAYDAKHQGWASLLRQKGVHGYTFGDDSIQASFSREAEDVSDLLIDIGMHPHTVLDAYYARMTKTASDALVFREARIRLAFAPITFVLDIAKTIGTSVKSVVKLLKDRVVLKLFNKVGWSFDKLYRAVKEGIKDLKEVSKSIYAYVKENGISMSVLKAGLWIEDWMDKYPNFKRYGVGLMILAAWFVMSFTGDLSYDFDLSEVVDAFAGNLSLAAFITSPEGAKFMVLIAMGWVGAGVMLPGSALSQFVVAVINTLLQYVGVRAERPKQDPIEEAEALGIA